MSAISSSFDQRGSSNKSSLADVRSFIKVGQENSTSIELYYEDRGSGPLEEINAALVEFLAWFAGNRGTPNS